MKKENIRIKGHRGTWYVINKTIHKGKNLYLLEHEQYGDMAACLIVDKDYNIILDDVWDGFDEIWYYDHVENFYR